MNVTVRRFADSDWESVRELHSLSFAHQAATHYTREQMQAIESMLRAPSYRQELQECNLRLAIIEKHIAGSAGWCQPDLKTARVRKVFVAPLHAGMGLGRRLMEVIESEIHASGIRNIIIRATMNAVPFYERLGFQKVRLDMMVSPEGVHVPMTMMDKQLV